MKIKRKSFSSRRHKKMVAAVRKGLAGIYSARVYRLKRVILPVLMVVIFALFTWFSVDNELRTIGAYIPNKVTVYSQKKYDGFFDNFYSMYAKAAKIKLSYEEFCESIDTRFLSNSQMRTLLRRYNESNPDNSIPHFIIVNTQGEAVVYYSMSDIRKLLTEISERGYLEEVQ